jgi:TonB family protein
MFIPEWYETAHQRFKRMYPRIMFVATVAAVALTGLGAIFSPPYVPSPYELRERKMQAVEFNTEIYIPPPPKELTAPEMPVQEIEASDDADAEDTMAITDFNPFEPPAIPRGSGSGPEEFVAFDSPPVLVHAEAPEYPDMAQQAESVGTIEVVITIDENGQVIHARIARSTASEMLEQAVLRAARKFLFEPARQRDVPVKCQIMVPFNFSLD